MTADSEPNELRLRAANGYLVWPLAALDLFREPDDATAWSRIHVRQAFVFGLLAAAGYLVLMALPLVLVTAIPAISLGATVWLYLAGLLADAAGAVSLFLVALRYRERAVRGELFAIPLVTVLADRVFRLDRD